MNNLETLKLEVLEMMSMKTSPNEVSRLIITRCEGTVETNELIACIIAFWYAHAELLRKELKSTKRFWSIWRIGQFTTRLLDRESSGELTRAEMVNLLIRQLEVWRGDKLIG